MGWTSYHATHYKPGGSIDRKAECDEYFMGGLNVGHYQILKKRNGWLCLLRSSHYKVMSET